MTDLPGITSTTRTLTADSERAISLASPVILLTLIPGAKSNSKRVITGPGNTAVTLASTPKSARRLSTSCDNSSNEIFENAFSVAGCDAFNKVNGGNSPGSRRIPGSTSIFLRSRSRTGSILVTTTGFFTAGGTTTTGDSETSR